MNNYYYVINYAMKEQSPRECRLGKMDCIPSGAIEKFRFRDYIDKKIPRRGNPKVYYFEYAFEKYEEFQLVELFQMVHLTARMARVFGKMNGFKQKEVEALALLIDPMAVVLSDDDFISVQGENFGIIEYVRGKEL